MPLRAASVFRTTPPGRRFLSESVVVAWRTVFAVRLTLERRFCSLNCEFSCGHSHREGSSMGSKKRSLISRREFARRAAFVSAAASLSPGDLLTSKYSVTAKPPVETPPGPKLSPESQTEMESRLQAVFAQYGSRLNDAQKSDLQRLAVEGQAALDRLRAYPTDNSDGPALYLKPLIEREKKAAPPASRKPAGAPQKP